MCKRKKVNVEKGMAANHITFQIVLTFEKERQKGVLF